MIARPIEKRQPRLVDFHCHLDLYPDHPSEIAERERLAIHTLTMTNAPSVWRRNRLTADGSKYVNVALGLHPQLASEREGELPIFKKYLPETRFVGEVGLDGSPNIRHTIETQKKVFRTILQLCESAGGKILSVHSRRAAKEVIDAIANYLPFDKGKVVLHWFTGSKTDAREALKAGCLFSVNFKMLESLRGRELLRYVPRDMVLTETDGPFANTASNQSTIADIQRVIAGLATIWGIDSAKVEETIFSNMNNLIGRIG